MTLLVSFGVILVLLLMSWVLRPRNSPSMGEFSGIMAWMWKLNAAYCTLFHRLETSVAPLPIAGPAILIANHTCNIDHFLLQAGTYRKLGFMIAKEYYDFPLFYPFCRMIGCIPVNRNGKDLAATRSALRALEEGRVVPMFPEGKILPVSGEEIGPGKHGVAFLALRAKVPVVPAYIRGTPRSNDFRKSFFTRSRSVVIYGPIIHPSEFLAAGPDAEERALLNATTDRLMAAIRDLKESVVVSANARS